MYDANQFELNRRTYEGAGLTEEIMKEISGRAMLSMLEIYLLFQAGRRIPDGGTYLELGAMFGGSYLCIRKAAEVVGTKLNYILIDMSPRETLRELVKDDPTVTIIDKHFIEGVKLVEDNTVDLMFNDADQLYIDQIRDICDCWDKLKVGGELIGHDYLCKGMGFKQTANAVDSIFDGQAYRNPWNTTLWGITKAKAGKFYERFKDNNKRREA